MANQPEASSRRCIPVQEAFGERYAEAEPHLKGLFDGAHVSTSPDGCSGDICSSYLVHNMPGGEELYLVLNRQDPITPHGLELITTPASEARYWQLLEMLGVTPYEADTIFARPSIRSLAQEQAEALRLQTAEISKNDPTIKLGPHYVFLDILSYLFYGSSRDRRYDILFASMDESHIRTVIENEVDAKDRLLLLEFYFGDFGTMLNKKERIALVASANPGIPETAIRKAVERFAGKCNVIYSHGGAPDLKDTSFDHRLLGLIKGTQRGRFLGEDTSKYTPDYVWLNLPLFRHLSIADMLANTDSIAEALGQSYPNSAGMVELFISEISALRSALNQTTDTSQPQVG